MDSVRIIWDYKVLPLKAILYTGAWDMVSLLSREMISLYFVSQTSVFLSSLSLLSFFFFCEMLDIFNNFYLISLNFLIWTSTISIQNAHILLITVMTNDNGRWMQLWTCDWFSVFNIHVFIRHIFSCSIFWHHAQVWYSGI